MPSTTIHLHQNQFDIVNFVASFKKIHFNTDLTTAELAALQNSVFFF